MSCLDMAEPVSLLIFSGVLERHPGLRVVVAESGIGWIPFVISLSIGFGAIIRTRLGHRGNGFPDPIPPPAGTEKETGPYWTGKQLFSLTLPSDLNLEFRSNIWTRGDDAPGAKHDSYVVIENGQLLRGTIDKKAIAYEKGAILDAIARNYGMGRARTFLDEMSRLSITAMRTFLPVDTSCKLASRHSRAVGSAAR